MFPSVVRLDARIDRAVGVCFLLAASPSPGSLPVASAFGFPPAAEAAVAFGGLLVASLLFGAVGAGLLAGRYRIAGRFGAAETLARLGLALAVGATVAVSWAILSA